MPMRVCFHVWKILKWKEREKQQQSTFEWCQTWVGQSSVSWRSNSSQISQKSLGGTALPRKKAKNLFQKSLSSTWTTLRWRWSRRTRRGCRRTRRAPAWSSGRRSCAACPRSRSSGTRPLITKMIFERSYITSLEIVCEVSCQSRHATWKPSLKVIRIVCVSWQVILESYPNSMCRLKAILESYPNSMCFLKLFFFWLIERKLWMVKEVAFAL